MAKSDNKTIICKNFRWKLGSRGGVYTADGRSNSPGLGRHSLGTRDRTEALQNLERLDHHMAVKNGLAAPSTASALEQHVDLLEGRKLYEAYVRRAAVMGGAGEGTQKRYRAVFDKFVAFAQQSGILGWERVSLELLEAYGAYLDDDGYAYATEYLELTTIKQAHNFLIDRELLPTSCRFKLHLTKVDSTTAYCYAPEQIQAMLGVCRATPSLRWLHNVVVALTHTGLRISELAALRWTDIQSDFIRIPDRSRAGSKSERAKARTNKGRRDRSFPLHHELKAVLEQIPRHPDGRIFHGPLGGVLKPDTVRTVLIREVINPLRHRWPSPDDEPGFKDGRLHSFRHYFCSMCANTGVPEQLLMQWLGHRDSKMVKRYYHAHDTLARDRMNNVNFIGGNVASVDGSGSLIEEAGGPEGDKPEKAA